ncbi:uncharacterized protein LOC120195430 [Hibiscus syriacus]|uniref:uncharacterized protein LOC120195430 n=1 Tax=Hibiscus syriacus TaxID=106335 RepID=UPI00192342E3|nr:uncharacterized protein LOC120195430 [Hibiscus syriacus]
MGFVRGVFGVWMRIDSMSGDGLGPSTGQSKLNWRVHFSSMEEQKLDFFLLVYNNGSMMVSRPEEVFSYSGMGDEELLEVQEATSFSNWASHCLLSWSTSGYL